MKKRRRSVTIRHPDPADEAAFLAAVLRSRKLHRPWVKAPGSPAEFRKYILKTRQPNCESFLILYRGELAGDVTVDQIVHGSFCSAYLGYYTFEPYAGQGLMRIGLTRVIDHAFKKLRLHRLEANVQPANKRSIALVKRLGFRLEGYSRRYLKVAGRWRGHQRWALLAEDW